MKNNENENCIFCKIINKTASCYIIAENKYAMAFLDISNDCFGHTLVIPKKHFENTMSCPDKYLAETIKLAKKIANHYVTDLGFEGVNILNANGKAAEQSVMHLHFHIIPRKANDLLKIWPTLTGSKFKLEDAQKILKLDL